MKYVIDLDDTLIESTQLNNDAYNYALLHYGFNEIESDSRITRKCLGFIDKKTLKKVVRLKQKYFTRKWLPFRLQTNKLLIDKIEKNGKSNCVLWTKADSKRVNAVLRYCGFEKYFYKIIIEPKNNFTESINILTNNIGTKNFIIYENDYSFFKDKNVNIVDEIKTETFVVKGYMVK